jgi:hypothetical protein
MPMRALAAVLAIATTFTLACDDQGPVDFLVGTFVLQTVDGSALPYLASQRVYRDTLWGLPVDVVESDELLSDTLHFADITYRQISIFQVTELLTDAATGETVDSNVTLRSVTHWGDWGGCDFLGSDTIVTFRFDPAGDMWSGSVSDGALTVTWSGVEYVYARAR